MDELLLIQSLGLTSTAGSPQLKNFGIVSTAGSPRLKSFGIVSVSRSPRLKSIGIAVEDSGETLPNPYLLIDGQDIYSQYFVLVAASGYKDLAAFPPLKSVESNDWAEEDGAEFDLSAPRLDSREFSIHFAFYGNDARFGSFIKLLSDGAYHDFNFIEIGKTYRLRLVSQPDMSQVQTLGKFSLKFADDFPLSGYTYSEPQSNIVPQRGYELDGRDLSDYGIYIL
jgi:hypothetical protein